MKKWLAKKLRELLSEGAMSHKKDKEYSLEENIEKVANALTLLGTQYTQEAVNEECVQFEFMFQGGRFRFFISKDNSVKIIFPFFYSVEPDSLTLLRFSCNECNLNSSRAKFVYTFEENKNLYYVHIQSFLLLTEGDALDISIARNLKEIYKMERHFQDVIETNQSRFKKIDDEYRINIDERKLFLLCEQELYHRHKELPNRVDKDKKLTLGTIFEQFYNYPSDAIASMTMVRLPFASELCNEATYSLSGSEVADYELLTALVAGSGKNATFVYNCATITVQANELASSGNEQRFFSILLQKEGETDDSLYVRITINSAPLSKKANAEYYSSIKTAPSTYSFIMAYDRTEPTARLQEFEFMLQDAKDKLQDNRSSGLTTEQRMMLSNTKPNISYALYFGTRFFYAQRYYEALTLLESVYDEMQKNIEKYEDKREMFFQLCFFIGYCYAELKLYHRALFYLQIIFPVRKVTYTMEYVNCMVNSGDFRALPLVEDLIENINNALEDEEETDETLLHFLDFLRRRKVYILIEKREFETAVAECKKMLDEPNNHSFALSELAYIEGLQKSVQ